MTKETGGPAFPSFPDGHIKQFIGMTLRDYFAAKAMAALVHNSTPWDAADGDMIARDAYNLADAMLKARELCNRKK